MRRRRNSRRPRRQHRGYLNLGTDMYSVFENPSILRHNYTTIINTELLEMVKSRLNTFLYLMKTVIHISEKLPFETFNNSISQLLFHWKTLYGSSLEQPEQATHVKHNIANTLMYSYINNCAINTISEVQNSPEKITENELFNLLSKIKLRNLSKILDNKFVNDICINDILNIFCKTQQLYRAFTKLAIMWKKHKATIQVDYDLGLNPINIATTPAITIYQNGAGYIFKVADLINIFHSALVHSPNFFVDPLFPKNPYTNIPFTKATLYNAYFCIKRTDFKMPLLFHLFYEVEFDIHQFMYNNEAIIRDIYIQDFVKTSTTECLYVYVKQMIKSLDKRRQLKIHADFPQETLVDIMRPYLHLYLLHAYSLSNNDRKLCSHYKLQRKFARFIRYNPQFGRKILVPKRPWSVQFPKSLDKHYPHNPFKPAEASPLLEQMLKYQSDINNVDGIGIELSRNGGQYFSRKQFIENPENKCLRYTTTFNTKHMSYYSEEFIPSVSVSIFLNFSSDDEDEDEYDTV